MAGQEHAQSRRDDEEPATDPDTPTPVTSAAQARDAEVDALLEEIDDVLETNAEQFVRGFVQKGGQ
jgi:ubiquitin-like protein Pup